MKTRPDFKERVYARVIWLMTNLVDPYQEALITGKSPLFGTRRVPKFLTRVFACIMLIGVLPFVFYLFILRLSKWTSEPRNHHIISRYLHSLYPSDIQNRYGDQMALVMEEDCQAAFERGGQLAYCKLLVNSTFCLLQDVARIYWSRWSPLKMLGLS